MIAPETVRRRYAQAVAAGCGARIEQAFATVAREAFLGPPPWRVLDHPGHRPTVTDDPALLYQDALVVLSAERGINNGQPSLHARCLAAVAPAPGEVAVHIGAGTGYYSAMLAEGVAPGGQVHAYEIEADLAERAAACLRPWPQVQVHHASGTAAALPVCDVLYVSAGATHPLPQWLDALAPGGRLVFPLTPDDGWGCMLLVTRRAGGHTGLPGAAQAGVHYAARALMRVSFIPCVGARDEAASRSLAAAMATRSLESVRSLRRGGTPDASLWCAGEGWWLSTAEAG